MSWLLLNCSMPLLLRPQLSITSAGQQRTGTQVLLNRSKGCTMLETSWKRHSPNQGAASPDATLAAAFVAGQPSAAACVTKCHRFTTLKKSS